MNLFKRFTALFLAAILVTGLFPVDALASEQELLTFETTHINPLYADLISENDLRPAAVSPVQTYESVNYVKTVEEAGRVLADQMEEREETAIVYIFGTEWTQEYFDALTEDILSAAFTHTGVPTEGDYIHWHYYGTDINGSAITTNGGYNMTLTYTVTYHSSAEQEAEVDVAVEKLLSELNLSGKSDYDKVKAVYDYICENVTYDDYSSGTLKHSAYAALIKKTAVCQGYASLLYRLLLELGIDNRVITGTGNGGPHGWNIIELDNLYYNADSTWDAGRSSYGYFLKSPDSFTDHTRDKEYTTSAFNSAYPMSSTDYVPSNGNDDDDVDGIAISESNFPDANFRAYLLEQDYGSDSVLTDAEIANITTIDVDEMSIRSLVGIEYFTALAELHCNVNNLTSLDLRNNTALTQLYCAQNQIATLDLSYNTALEYAFIGYNALTSLTIGNNSSLIQLGCDHNNLKELVVSGAPSLNFLGCTYNQLTALDISKNTALTELECSNNHLTNLDLSKNTALTELLCNDNTYTLDLDEKNQFDLSSLPGNFDASKTSSWSGGSVSGNILTAEKETITYSYDVGNEMAVTFTLKGTLSAVHTHSYTRIVVEPTCTDQGYTEYTCACGDTYKESYTDPLGHDYAEDVTPPTCLEGGYTTFTCSRCDDTYVGAETEATGHQYEEVVTPPTCTEGGYSTFTCSCGETYTGNETEATGHDYATKVTAPTCTEQGYTTYICINCSNTYMDTYVDATGHSYSQAVIEPTCTEGGYTSFTCSCGETYITDEVAALGHTEVVDAAVDVTCTTAGKTEGTHCSTCLEIFVAQEEIPTPGHNWDEGTVTKEPTKDEAGVMIYTCTVCEEIREEVLPTLSNVRRVYGQDRIETALAVAAELKETLGVEKFDSIIIAAGGTKNDQNKFADALSGSYLASVKKAPILLYTKDELSEKNMTFIAENLSANGTIYLLGGNVSIPAEVEDALKAAGYTTKRLGGADRYETNRIILNEAGIGNAQEVLIAGGQAFADSLSASATGLPIMLVKGTASELNDAQITFLQGLSGKKITILGGNAAVSAELEAAIEEVVGVDVNRVFGDTREHTSAMIAETYFPDADTAVIAYSKMYPDGLAGGVLANVLGAPLLLTNSGKEDIANDYIEEYEIEAGYVLGGTAVVTDETARLVFGLSEDAVINEK